MNFAEKVTATKVADGQAAVFYLGQVGFLIKTPKISVLVDPYLTDYVDQHCCSEAVLWKRLYAPVCTPDALPAVDYVLCTHSHYDHSDPDTLLPLAKSQSKVKFIAPAGLCDLFVSYGIEKERFIPAKQDTPICFEGMTVTPVPAAHEDIHYDENGVCLEMGYVMDFDGIKAYHAGDTIIYDGMNERVHGADIGFIPINGRDYFRTRDDIIGNTDSGEALRFAKEAEIGMLVPTHYDLYNVNRVTSAEFLLARDRVNPDQIFHMFVPGERFIYMK